jgi:hypothetical protein
MANTTFALIVFVINAPSFALLIKGWLDHRKWQEQNPKQDLQWEISRVGWDLELRIHRQILDVASKFRLQIRSLQSELAQARAEITDLQRRLGGGEPSSVA